jgi:hypothetical protein
MSFIGMDGRTLTMVYSMLDRARMRLGDVLAYEQ